MKCIKTAQYHDATNDMLYLNFSMVFPMNFAKTAQYHDATNDTRHLIFPWYATWNSPKRLSTTMLQMTNVISIFHGNSHGIHQNGSVPQCYKWRALSDIFVVFSMEFTKTTQYHDATNNTLYQIFHDISDEFHKNGSVPQCYTWHSLSHFFRGISHENHQNGSVPWCYN